LVRSLHFLIVHGSQSANSRSSHHSLHPFPSCRRTTTSPPSACDGETKMRSTIVNSAARCSIPVFPWEAMP
jgi:hypothetical protein